MVVNFAIWFAIFTSIWGLLSYFGRPREGASVFTFGVFQGIIQLALEATNYGPVTSLSIFPLSIFEAEITNVLLTNVVIALIVGIFAAIIVFVMYPD
jgi:hypothetical protein